MIFITLFVLESSPKYVTRADKQPEESSEILKEVAQGLGQAKDDKKHFTGKCES